MSEEKKSKHGRAVFCKKEGLVLYRDWRPQNTNDWSPQEASFQEANAGTTACRVDFSAKKSFSLRVQGSLVEM